MCWLSCFQGHTNQRGDCKHWTHSSSQGHNFDILLWKYSVCSILLKFIYNSVTIGKLQSRLWRHLKHFPCFPSILWYLPALQREGKKNLDKGHSHPYFVFRLVAWEIFETSLLVLEVKLDIARIDDPCTRRVQTSHLECLENMLDKLWQFVHHHPNHWLNKAGLIQTH